VAVLNAQNVFKVFADGDSDRVVLYALRKISTGDTVDVGLGALNDFLAPKAAAVIGTTVTLIASCVITGTVVTIPLSMTNDAGWLLVWGASA